MFVNKFKINLSTLKSGSTDVAINIPITMSSQNVDYAELIQKDFVTKEVENAINPIIDYEKVRFLPLDLQKKHVDKIIYQVYLFDKQNNYTNSYGSIGFDNDDVILKKETFGQTHVFLGFYDSDNPLTQNLITYVTLFSEIKTGDLQQNGKPKPISQIYTDFVVENPLINKMGFSEGYHLYDYKSGLNIGEFKYLYMKASFRNAKTGKNINLMVKNSAQDIDKLVHELYTRYKLVRENNGYYYIIDDIYEGNNPNNTINNNNVNYSSNPNNCTIKLYEIKST